MITIYILSTRLSPSPHSDVKRLVRGNWTWKSCGAVFGLAGGLAAPIFGSLLTVVSWFRDSAWHGLSLRSAGTALFVLAIPLLVIGAHCLDLLDKD